MPRINHRLHASVLAGLEITVLTLDDLEPGKKVCGFLLRGAHMDNDAGSCLPAVGYALVGLHKISGQSGRDIFKALGIQVGEWEPRTGDLDHNPVATQKRMVHVWHIETQGRYLVWHHRFGL